VRLYHDQALVKQPKAGKTPWHQDHFYWPIDSPNTVTMWMPMHDCPRAMGTMRFAVGSHTAAGLEMMPISEQSEEYFEKEIVKHGFEVDSFDLEAGDATFHYGRTLHCAHSNGQPCKREVMTIIFFEDGAKAVPEQQMNSFRKVDLSVFCPGTECGQPIQSNLNPVII
jgi:ectoine hydroxylase-related dioxygenase (phytanoyl-CoA dioxygenase family)